MSGDPIFEIQQAKYSAKVIQVGNLPDKTGSVKGITWLPRLIKKSQAKLRGEIPPGFIYDCGGDLKFF